MSHGGLGTREYYEECVSRTVRTVKRAARKRSNNAAASAELKSGAKFKLDSGGGARKNPSTTKPAPQSVKVGQAAQLADTTARRKAPKMTAPPHAKSVKIRQVAVTVLAL